MMNSHSETNPKQKNKRKYQRDVTIQFKNTKGKKRSKKTQLKEVLGM